MGYNNFHNHKKTDKPKRKWGEEIKEEWITSGISDEAIKFANDFGKYLKEEGMSTSQIRNIFGELRRIQMVGYEKEKVSFKLLKPKIAYIVGREKKNVLRDFKSVFDKLHGSVRDRKTFENFVSLFEAILAYHKYYGGK